MVAALQIGSRGGDIAVERDVGWEVVCVKDEKQREGYNEEEGRIWGLILFFFFWFFNQPHTISYILPSQVIFWKKKNFAKHGLVESPHLDSSSKPKKI